MTIANTLKIKNNFRLFVLGIISLLTIAIIIVGLNYVPQLLANEVETESETETEAEITTQATVKPPENPAWEDLKPFRGKIRTNGETGKKRRFYHKDFTHKDVEVYDRNGLHLGSMDPNTGRMTKPPVDGRELNLR